MKKIPVTVRCTGSDHVASCPGGRGSSTCSPEIAAQRAAAKALGVAEEDVSLKLVKDRRGESPPGGVWYNATVRQRPCPEDIQSGDEVTFKNGLRYSTRKWWVVRRRNRSWLRCDCTYGSTTSDPVIAILADVDQVCRPRRS